MTNVSEHTSTDDAPTTAATTDRLPLEPMDPQIQNVQPGGGVVMHLELAWGHWRRWYLKTFRKGYVRRMAALRQGDFNPCPFEVLDPRDLKIYRNQGGYYWKPEDDPFCGRDRLPFTRSGLAELITFSVLFFGLAVGLSCLLVQWSPAAPWNWIGWLAVTAVTVIGLLIVWFFRDPPRKVPTDVGLVVSPADGKVVDVKQLEHDEFVDGPAVMIGIFLSIFNVHLNRMPIAGRIIGLSYKPGKYLNALKPASAIENEQLAVRLEGETAPHRRMIVRQIAGAIARRIVCWVKPGDGLSRGERFGMIKLGSRTEIVIPQEEGLEIIVTPGTKVKAGSSILARYGSHDNES